MKFMVSRASDFVEGGTRKPCADAKPEIYNGDSIWVVELTTLGGLKDFINREGDVIVRSGFNFDGFNFDGWITIYDDYVE